MRRVVIALLPLTFLAAACQSGATMWAPCAPGSDPTGTDGQYVLVCTAGQWVPIMTVGEWVKVRRGEPVAFSPRPVRPNPSTTTTTSTTSTSTPTTSSTTSTTSSTTSTTLASSAPYVLDVQPPSGPTSGGTSVELTGEYLTGATSVSFGGTAAPSFTVNSDTSITVVSPAHAAGIVNVIVTTPVGVDGGSIVNEYQYV